MPVSEFDTAEEVRKARMRGKRDAMRFWKNWEAGKPPKSKLEKDWRSVMQKFNKKMQR